MGKKLIIVKVNGRNVEKAVEPRTLLIQQVRLMRLLRLLQLNFPADQELPTGAQN